MKVMKLAEDKELTMILFVVKLSSSLYKSTYRFRLVKLGFDGFVCYYGMLDNSLLKIVNTSTSGTKHMFSNFCTCVDLFQTSKPLSTERICNCTKESDL